MKSLREFVEELERITLTKFELIGENVAMSVDRVVTVAPVGYWERKIGLDGYVEVSLSDFCPEIVRCDGEVMGGMVYLRYSLPRPIRTLSGGETGMVSFKAVPLLALIYLLKRFYGRFYIYLNVKRLAPLIVRPSKLEVDEEGFEGLIAPRFT
ncbi:MAG: hypothetical protein NDF54_07030 [archaeon GB-1867-035]|nr:hypothetical protein [Candidatus Culexmicrobium profundum]